MKKKESKKEVVEQTEEQKREQLNKLVQENLSIIYHLITTNIGLIYTNCDFVRFAKIIFPEIHLFDIYDANELVLDLEDEDIRDILDKYRSSLVYLAKASVVTETDTKVKTKISIEDRYERNIKVNNVLNQTLKEIEVISKWYTLCSGREYDFFEHITLSIIIEIEKEKIGRYKNLIGEIFFDDIEKEDGGIYNE